MNPGEAVFVTDQRLEEIVETGNNTSLQTLYVAYYEWMAR